MHVSPAKFRGPVAPQAGPPASQAIPKGGTQFGALFPGVLDGFWAVFGCIFKSGRARFSYFQESACRGSAASRHCGGSDRGRLVAAGTAAPGAARHLPTMDEGEVFRFDLRGFVVLRGVMTPPEVAAANAALDRHEHEFGGLEAAQDMLGWSAKDSAPFAAMLAHPRVVPLLNTICGSGFRMDHAPTLIRMDAGDGGRLGLHGSSGPGFDPKQYPLRGIRAIKLTPKTVAHRGIYSFIYDVCIPRRRYYHWQNGQMHNGLVVVNWMLVDQGPGDGGFACVPGTHKSNLRGPPELYSYDEHQDLVYQEDCKAGDVVIFTGEPSTKSQNDDFVLINDAFIDTC